MRRFPDYERYPALMAGAALSNRAWICVTPERMLDAAPTDIANTEMGGVPGALGEPVNDGQALVNLDFEMLGDCDPDGVAYPDFEIGLRKNKKLFIATYYRAERDEFGCVDFSIEDLDGEVFEGPVQPHEPIWGPGGTECGFTMQVTIPRGELVLAGS